MLLYFRIINTSESLSQEDADVHHVFVICMKQIVNTVSREMRLHHEA